MLFTHALGCVYPGLASAIERIMKNLHFLLHLRLTVADTFFTFSLSHKL